MALYGFKHTKENMQLTGIRYEDAFAEGAIGGAVTTDTQHLLRYSDDHPGGCLVPDSMEDRILNTLKENNVIRHLATAIHSETTDRIIPIATGMTEAKWIAEGDDIDIGEAAFNAVRMHCNKLGIMVQVSNELLKDAGVLMDGFLADAFAEQLASAEEKAFLTGDGVNQPLGILNTPGMNVGTIATAKNNITVDEIMALYHSLDEKYRQHACFIMHEDTAHALRAIKDSAGRYLWHDSMTTVDPDRFLGHPVYTSRFMPKMTAGAKAVILGDISKYLIVDRQNRTMTRYDELFALYGNVGFRMVERVDGKLVIPEAVKALKMAD